MRITNNHRLRAAALALVAVTASLAASPLASSAAPAPALVPVTQALFEMNEPAGATVMLDSSGSGLNTPIDQNGLDTGFSFDGATGYTWARKGPNSLPVAPERIIQVADNALLDPRGDTFTVEIRFRTKENFGNIIQKGQSATVGGQWKIQNPMGLPSCLFKSSAGRAAVRSKVNTSDNVWHTITCLRTPTRVTMYVDGVSQGSRNAPTGIIDNKIPMTIGGKINCDQVITTCDYFSGQIDYVKVTRGA